MTSTASTRPPTSTPQPPKLLNVEIAMVGVNGKPFDSDGAFSPVLDFESIEIVLETQSQLMIVDGRDGEEDVPIRGGTILLWPSFMLRFEPSLLPLSFFMKIFLLELSWCW